MGAGAKLRGLRSSQRCAKSMVPRDGRANLRVRLRLIHRASALPVLEKLAEAGVRRRAERLYQRLDDLPPLGLVGRCRPSVAHQNDVLQSRSQSSE